MNIFLGLLTDPFVAGRNGGASAGGGSATPFTEVSGSYAYAARQDAARDAFTDAHDPACVARPAEHTLDALDLGAQGLRIARLSGYFEAHDFALYVLRVEHVRWIAGFGSMGWIERDEWSDAPAADPLAPHAQSISKHMNRDHPDGPVQDPLCSAPTGARFN